MIKLSALVVEQEFICALAMTGMLRSHGFTVLPAIATGEDALRVAAENKIDIVFMGISLRGTLNGIETAKLFKENGGPAVVFVSAYDAPSIVAKAMEMQPLAYLVKPVDMEELKTFLRGLALGHVEVAVSRL